MKALGMMASILQTLTCLTSDME